MDKVSASDAKQKFGEVLERASARPVAIERHGRIVAAMVPAEWLSRESLLDERRYAREQQRLVEQSRLMAHQRLGIDLLTNAGKRNRLLKDARRQVRRWSEENLCSQDYIDRWNEWLSLPEAELVVRMCGDADGWGKAMRQNSPFSAAMP